MQKDSKHKCASASHKQLKSNAKNRLDELQDIFTNLQYARKEGQDNAISALEEQVNQMLTNWKTELNETSSTSSLHGPGSGLGLDSADIRRLLSLSDEEDDATSPFDESKVQKHKSGGEPLLSGDGTFLFSNLNPSTNYIMQERGFEGSNHMSNNFTDSQAQYGQFDMQLRDGLDHNLENMLRDSTDFNFVPAPAIPPQPAAFYLSKCALWDCPRPPLTLDHDYCSSIHANLALKEGAASIGTGPILRPGGISLNDNILFHVLKGKIQGKEVGIPECDGAVSARSPWNAPELFDLSLCEGETIREWLFFDKPRKAFESGNRKQRSLPDYNGRGWHESRKQILKEGLKRSYYMDPQPASHLEWHLFEYGIDKSDACALYRLELKLVDGKKKSKGKVAKDPVATLQMQMGKLTADLPLENKVSTMSMRETNKAFDECGPCAPNQLTPTAGSMDNGNGDISDDYVDILSDCKRV